MNDNKILSHMKDAEDLSCAECGHKYFKEVYRVKKISKFLTGDNKDAVIPIPVLVCANCGNLNEELDLG